MGRLFYFLKEAVRGFFQAKLMTFASILTIATSLFLLALSTIGYINIEGFLQKADQKPDLSVYLLDKTYADSSALETVIGTISALVQVEKIELIGKDSAMEIFKTFFGEDMAVAIDENPLPASLEITLSRSLRGTNSVEQFKQTVLAIPGVDAVQYNQEWIELLERFRNYFLIATSILGVVLLVALHFMVSNTIKLTIYARKELVRNMYFVGATDTFIKVPYIIEGMLQGFIGGSLSIAALVIVKLFFSQLPIIWGPDWLPHSILILGVSFGWIGSAFAVRKFLV